ncbi:hypothetical protein ARMGADRAFT_1059293 [Armillaria gallica]|uniref:Ndc10 domain-containing protein n=1 Tax=Armillaria gallica TaxID=47427 RepID=A0A2H3DUT0_ARMGA|nr:hypothetical protein ARMGADRAFT_1059293 [Armillaria gallica]
MRVTRASAANWGAWLTRREEKGQRERNKMDNRCEGERQQSGTSRVNQNRKREKRQSEDSELQGHGIRIGSTLEYLLRGIPFDVVKMIGRWKSDAFILYLRKHAQILAPYMQAVPAIHEQFIRYTMPRIR